MDRSGYPAPGPPDLQEDQEEAPAEVEEEVANEDQLSTPDVLQEDPLEGAVTGTWYRDTSRYKKLIVFYKIAFLYLDLFYFLINFILLRINNYYSCKELY